MRVLFVCRGRPGLGHIMPAMAVDQALRESQGSSYESWFASYGLPITAIKSVNLIEVQYPYAGVGYTGLPVIRGLWPNLDDIIGKLKPDIIVGSGEFLLPLYGVVTGMKVVLLANLRYLRINEGYFGNLKPLLTWLHDRAALVLDYSIDGAQESNQLGTNTRWVGPLVRRSNLGELSLLRSRLNLPTSGSVVLFTKGGGEDFPLDTVKGKGSRNQQEELNFKLIQSAIKVASINKAESSLSFVLITGLGNLYDRALSAISKLKLTNIRCVKFAPNIMEYIAVSDIVVGRGGVSLIGEAVIHMRPQILIPIHSDSEQLANTTYLAERRAAVSIPTDRLTPGRLNAAIKQLLAEPNEGAEMAKRARDLFPNIDEAPRAAAHAIRSLGNS